MPDATADSKFGKPRPEAESFAIFRKTGMRTRTDPKGKTRRVGEWEAVYLGDGEGGVSTRYRPIAELGAELLEAIELPRGVYRVEWRGPTGDVLGQGPEWHWSPPRPCDAGDEADDEAGEPAPFTAEAPERAADPFELGDYVERRVQERLAGDRLELEARMQRERLWYERREAEDRKRAEQQREDDRRRADEDRDRMQQFYEALTRQTQRTQADERDAELAELRAVLEQQNLTIAALTERLEHQADAPPVEVQQTAPRPEVPWTTRVGRAVADVVEPVAAEVGASAAGFVQRKVANAAGKPGPDAKRNGQARPAGGQGAPGPGRAGGN